MRSPVLRSLLAGVGALAIAAGGVVVAPDQANADIRAIDALDAADAALVPIVEHVPGTEDRYDLAGGCFALYAPAAGAYVARVGDGYGATAPSSTDAEPFLLRSFDLGKYLVVDTAGEHLAVAPGIGEQVDQETRARRSGLPVTEGTDITRGFYDDLPSAEIPAVTSPPTWDGSMESADRPSALAEWIVRDGAAPGSFTIHLPVDDGFEDDPGPSEVDGDAPVAGTLTVAADGTLTVASGDVRSTEAQVRPEPVDGPCHTPAEVEVNVEGPLVAGDHPVDEVRGYIDGHLHMMAFEFIGGRSRCGRPWHPYGVEYALRDCPDHEDGYGRALAAVMGSSPDHGGDGWPTFGSWPKHNDLIHEQVYYRWMERAWRGGLRMFTNLMVDNNALCEAWVPKRNSCNEMDGVRLQAQRLRELERYVDAQWGGPGQGWFRIVTDPFEARRAMHEGRLAVVMGIEVSVLFDCGLAMGVPLCDEEKIDRELAAVYDLGIRQMELVNKFDNALSGVKGDGRGDIINVGNFWDTGQWWQMETCPEDARGHDHTQNHVPGQNQAPGPVRETIDGFGRDEIFGAMFEAAGRSGAAPLYPEGPHCNVRGLTDLGRHLLTRMAEHGMLFDPDHMSGRGRHEALDFMAENGFTGIMSSHSWADDHVYERTLELGGMVTSYAGGSTGFLGKWRQAVSWSDSRYYFGFGYGADTNGFGGQGGPRRPSEDADLDYPFTGLGGVQVHQQVSGERTYDLNLDGVAHYGLYADWVEDVALQAGPDRERFLEDMARGSEAYLQTWERAMGVANDACRDDRVQRVTAKTAATIRTGTHYQDVLARLGQPSARSGGVFRYCLAEGEGTVSFDDAGRVTAVSVPDVDDTVRNGRPAEAPGKGKATGRPAAPHDHATHPHGFASASGGSAGVVLLLGLVLGLGLTRSLRHRD